ncbi:MAG TPA: hypothetical protein VJT73_19135 [Polyangiaceae bacterium]|nr:hypothetical protein [Polyangiaceae bacterium]
MGPFIAAALTAVDIQWEAPPECPDVNEVRSTTERLLGQPLDTPRSQQLLARAKVRRTAAGNWEVSFTLASNERSTDEVFAAKQCRTLADAAAMKVAMAVDPTAVVESVMSLPAKAATNKARTPESAAPLLAPPVAAPRAALRAVSGSGFGFLPNVSPGVGLFGAVISTGFRAELGGQFFWGTEARYPDHPEVGATLQLASGVLRGCATPSAGMVEFPICGGVEFGVMRGEGFGVATTYQASSPWAALSIGPAVRIRMGSVFSLWIEANSVMPFIRPGFRMRNLNTLFSAPSGGARAWVGVEMVLGG